MKPSFFTTSALLLPVLFGALVLDVTATPSAAAPQTDKDREFRDKFQSAMKIGAKDEMKKLVDRNLDQAVTWIIQTSETLSNAPNDVVAERMDALRTAWKDSKDTAFCQKMERYFSLLDPTIKRERVRMRGQFDKAVNEFWANNEKKDGSTYVKLASEFAALADAFEQVGDWYYNSQAWNLVGHCFDEGNRGKKDADLKKACAAYLKCLAAREQIELKDSIYLTTKPRTDQLVALGFGPQGSRGPVAGPGGEGGEGAMAEVGPAITANMSFELIEEVDAIARPSYYLDEVYPSWNSIFLSAKGTQVPLPRVENGPPIMRLGSAKVVIDVDKDGEGDGDADVEIPLRGRLEPVVFEIGEGAAKRKMAFLAVTGAEKDTYQEVEVNLAPVDQSMSIYVTAAGSMVGEVDGTPLRVIDDDMDGVYGSLPQTWGHVGMTPEKFQPEMDSMVIGKSKRAVPFSEYTQIDEQWYKLEVQNGGTSLVAHPLNLRTGKVTLEYKGLKPSFIIIRGQNEYENSFFDLASAKTIEVPIGRYELYFGMVAKGKKKQVMKAVMIAGADTETWDVLAGSEVEITLGAPYGFGFTATVDDQSVLVEGSSVCVVGSGGERYERIWNAVPRPEVSIRKVGSTRGTKPEEMPKVNGQDAIYSEGWAVAWFPRDLEVPNRLGEDVEVQLTEKKNKLFGKIESVWR